MIRVDTMRLASPQLVVRGHAARDARSRPHHTQRSCMRRAATFHRLLHAQAFRSPMGKGARKSSAQDVLFYELSRCARDANAAQALLAFDAATDNVSDAFEARIYHKLLALLVDRPSDSARVRQHMDERGVTRDETMVPASTLLPAEFAW